MADASSSSPPPKDPDIRRDVDAINLQEEIERDFSKSMTEFSTKYAGMDDVKVITAANVRDAKRAVIRGERYVVAWKFKLWMSLLEYLAGGFSGTGFAIILNEASPKPHQLSTTGQPPIVIGVAPGQFLPTIPWWVGLICVIVGAALFLTSKVIEANNPQKRWK